MGDSPRAPEASRSIEEHIARMPSLSVTATRVLEICNNPQTSAIDLNRVIALDPVLMGQVLRLVNSAFYGNRSTVTTLPRAIIMLGVNTVKNLVLSLAVLKVMGDEGAYKTFSMEEFWLHSLCTGVAAKRLAAVRGLPLEACWDCFVGGLLHDLGKIPLNSLYPAQYAQALDGALQEHVCLCERERLSFGLDHMHAGSLIGRKWRLGSVLEDCLAYHHDPECAAPENRGRVALVELADACAKHFKIGNAGGTPPEREELERLCAGQGLAMAEIEAFEGDLTEEIANARSFLQLSKGDGHS
jgi:HD-like signal output (HDOD) protein